jgi:hypothetical protein
MEVSTWFGSKPYGVRIGAANRDRYFVRTWSEIEVELDGQIHTFLLTEGFWNKCPEFRDPGKSAIKDWLQRHKTIERPRGHPPRMSLIPLGGNKFRLVP